MSMHRLSAGSGYQYLLRHTAAGDVQRLAGTPLTAYYTASGYPPGRWLGGGLTGLGQPADTGARHRGADAGGAATNVCVGAG